MLNRRRSSDLKKIPSVPITSKVVPKPRVVTRPPVKKTEVKAEEQTEIMKG